MQYNLLQKDNMEVLRKLRKRISTDISTPKMGIFIQTSVISEKMQKLENQQKPKPFFNIWIYRVFTRIDKLMMDHIAENQQT